jgi:transposase-like protein
MAEPGGQEEFCITPLPGREMGANPAYPHQLRKVLKTKGSFPTEAAALKLIYLALMNIEKKRVKSVRTWRQALPQLAIMFGEQRVLGTT